MKNLFVLLFLGLLLNVKYLSASEGEKYYGDLSIGTIIYSYFHPSEFFKHNPESDWMQIGTGNCQLPVDSELCTTFRKKNPNSNCMIANFAGQFIRISGGEAASVGIIQPGSTAMPKNPIKVTIDPAGAHDHRMAGGGGRSSTGASTFGTGYCEVNRTDMTPNHTHGASVSGGDSETRPSNVALYAYIRINELGSPKHKIKNLEERLKSAEADLKLLKRRNCPKLKSSNTAEVAKCLSGMIADFFEEKYFMGQGEIAKTVNNINEILCRGLDDEDTNKLFEQFYSKFGTSEIECK